MSMCVCLYKQANAVFVCCSGVVGPGGGRCRFRWDSAHPGFGHAHLLCALQVRTCRRKSNKLIAYSSR